MEKFFKVTEKSELYKDYFKYLDNLKKVNEHVKRFMIDNGMESKWYYACNTQFFIETTAKDIEKFDTVLGSPHGTIRPFRRNSKIGKAWIKLLKDNNLKIMDKPYLGFYFDNILGRHSSRLFDDEGIVYCSLDADVDFETPDGMIEMKASEFFKLIEGIQAKSKEDKEAKNG